MGRLFGTDGVRGRAGEPPLDLDTILHLGWAAAQVLGGKQAPEFLVGWDTRESGEMLAAALAAGIAAAGAQARLLEVLPTPGVAFLARRRGAIGVVISASHNPYEDNGVKFFSPTGQKLPDPLEDEIELALSQYQPMSKGFGRLQRDPFGQKEYVAALASGEPLSGLRVALDVAHGATCCTAPEVFQRLGAVVTVVHNAPDGRNINAGCGSTHPEALAALVSDGGFHLGAAFDGDGDRCILVDEVGQVVNGDHMLGILALDRRRRGQLRGPLVATVMSNLGLEEGLARWGIALVRTKVGDRYVAEELLKSGGNLGGEQSGHVLLLDLASTGDGVLTALEVARVMVRTGQRLSALAAPFPQYPQVLYGVPTARRDLAATPAVQALIARSERRLAGRGRINVRPSGTEPLIRVMVEGRDHKEIEELAQELVRSIAQLVQPRHE